MLKPKITEKSVKEKVINSTKKKIDQQIRKIVQEIKKKTIMYILWSLAGILLMTFSLPKTTFFIFSSAMVLFVLYLWARLIQPFKITLHFINNFDKEIEKSMEEEIKKQKEESLKNKIGLWLSGQSHRDIEDLVISYSVRELSRQFKEHKWIIVIRIGAYTISVLLFSKILFYMLT